VELARENESKISALDGGDGLAATGALLLTGELKNVGAVGSTTNFGKGQPGQS